MIAKTCICVIAAKKDHLVCTELKKGTTAGRRRTFKSRLQPFRIFFFSSIVTYLNYFRVFPFAGLILAPKIIRTVCMVVERQFTESRKADRVTRSPARRMLIGFDPFSHWLAGILTRFPRIRNVRPLKTNILRDEYPLFFFFFMLTDTYQVTYRSWTPTSNLEFILFLELICVYYRYC